MPEQQSPNNPALIDAAGSTPSETRLTGKMSKFNDPTSPDYIESDLEEVFGKDGNYKNPPKVRPGVSPYVVRSYHMRKRGTMKPGSPRAILAANNLYGMGAKAGEDGYITDPVTGIVTKADNSTEKALVHADKVTAQIQKEQNIEIPGQDNVVAANPAPAVDASSQAEEQQQDDNIDQEQEVIQEQHKILTKREKLVTREETLAKMEKEGFSLRRHVIDLEERQRKLYEKNVANTELQSRVMFQRNNEALKQLLTYSKLEEGKIASFSDREKKILQDILDTLKSAETAKLSDLPKIRERMTELQGQGRETAVASGNTDFARILEKHISVSQGAAARPGMFTSIKEHYTNKVRESLKERYERLPYIAQAVMEHTPGVKNLLNFAGLGEAAKMRAADARGRIASIQESIEEDRKLDRDNDRDTGSRTRRGSSDGTFSPRRISSGLGFLTGRNDEPRGTQDSDAPIKIDTLAIGTLTVDTLDIKNVDDHDKTKDKDKSKGLMGLIAGIIGGIAGAVRSFVSMVSGLAATLAKSLAALASGISSVVSGLVAFATTVAGAITAMATIGSVLTAAAMMHEGAVRRQFGDKAAEVYRQSGYEALGAAIPDAAITKDEWGTAFKDVWHGLTGRNDLIKSNVEPNPTTSSTVKPSAAAMKFDAGTPMAKLQNPTTAFHKMAEAPVVVPPIAAKNARTSMVDDGTRANMAMKEARGAAPIVVNNVQQGASAKSDSGMPLSMGSARNQESGFARYLLQVFSPM